MRIFEVCDETLNLVVIISESQTVVQADILSCDINNWLVPPVRSLVRFVLGKQTHSLGNINRRKERRETLVCARRCWDLGFSLAEYSAWRMVSKKETVVSRQNAYARGIFSSKTTVFACRIAIFFHQLVKASVHAQQGIYITSAVKSRGRRSTSSAENLKKTWIQGL